MIFHLNNQYEAYSYDYYRNKDILSIFNPD